MRAGRLARARRPGSNTGAQDMSPPLDLPARLRRLMAPAAGAAASAAGPQLLTVVAAALLAAQLALLVWNLVPGAARKPPPARPPPAGTAMDVSQLLRAPLFGAPPASTADGSNAPRTRVALVLTGTLAVRDPKQGLAIIGESAQTGRVYVVGGTLPGGVRLHEVYQDRVVLDRDGALETLPLPRQALAGATRRPALSPNGNAAEPPLAESVQQLIAQGPEVIGQILRPMPTYANGQLKGFRVYAGRDREKFAKLGLQAGDLVTQINGVPLSDPQRGMEILKSLGSAGSAQVTIERGGATQQLSVDASQVAGLGTQGGEPAAATPPAPAAADVNPPSSQ
jgi:general secretion pathway protein C